jgi:putative transposase
MFQPQATPADLRFAYCYHAYLHWRTHRLHAMPPLAGLNQPALQALASRFHIRILECVGTATEVRTLVSLQPTEAISACASKLKGQTSRWLREQSKGEQPANLLSKGYFACTAGKNTAAQVEAYLQTQDEHHGYAQRVLPPVYVATFTPTPELLGQLAPAHAVTLLNFHLVLCTAYRRGIFGADEGQAVAERWLSQQAAERMVIRKVSFVPDHVHIGLRVHPAVVPAQLVAKLMNSAQDVLFTRFRDEVLRACLNRLWQPSAYLGSFGDIASPQIHAYLRAWENAPE